MSTIVSFDATKFASNGFEFKVDTDKSLPIPKPEFEPKKMRDGGWLFPETIHIMADKNDEYLYAFGTAHVWRTSDVNVWELVR